MSAQQQASTFGLALSGGGSRAAAFHVGTLRALHDLALIPSIDVVSTVSGGSIFGAAWMASILRGEPTNAFLIRMQDELRNGFVARSISWRLLGLLLPGYTRSDLLARTFDRVFFKGLTLGALPTHPRLCINTTVLNNGQVGKFARDGFSTPDLGPPRDEHGSNVPVPLPDFPLARAAIASAAFPIGLPPILISPNDLGSAARRGSLANSSPLALTDGGVLENLGVQTLLRSRRFGTWNLIVSDAGLKDTPWRPRSFGRWATAFAIAALSASVLRRVLELMNDKENRSMRSLTVREVLAGRNGVRPEAQQRKLMFVRVNQTWRSMVANIPSWRLQELAGDRAAPAPGASAEEVTAFLEEHTEVPVLALQKRYDGMGGDERVSALNRVNTGFTALSSEDVDGLDQHAQWQIHATHAIYAAEPRRRAS